MKLKKWKMFEEFLRENNAIEVYYKNVGKQDGLSDIGGDDPRGHIGGVIYCRYSDEGFEYWDILNDKWQERLEELKKKPSPPSGRSVRTNQ